MEIRVTEHEYNQYLSKFKGKYKVIHEDQGNMLIIQGKYGRIEPYGEGKLQVWFYNPKDFTLGLSQKSVNRMFEKAGGLLSHCLNMTGEGSGVLQEESIREIASLIGVKKKRVVSEETRLRLKEQLRIGRSRKACK